MPQQTVESGPSSVEGALNGMRAELSAMRLVLQLRLPPRPPTPASPLVPAGGMDAATGAELASAYLLPPALSPDSASAVALRASVLKEVRFALRQALETALPLPLRRAAGSGSGTISRRAPLPDGGEPPAPRVLSVIAHREDPSPWRGWSPSPTHSARPPRSPVAPASRVHNGISTSASDGRKVILSPQLVRPRAPPPSPIRRTVRGRGQGLHQAGQSASIESSYTLSLPDMPQLRMQGPNSEGQQVDGKTQRARPASTGRVGLDIRRVSRTMAADETGVCALLPVAMIIALCISPTVAMLRSYSCISLLFAASAKKELGLVWVRHGTGDVMQSAETVRPARSSSLDSRSPTTPVASNLHPPPTPPPFLSPPSPWRLGLAKTTADAYAESAGGQRAELSAWLDTMMMQRPSGSDSVGRSLSRRRKEGAAKGDAGAKSWQAAHSGSEVVRVLRRVDFAPDLELDANCSVGGEEADSRVGPSDGFSHGPGNNGRKSWRGGRRDQQRSLDGEGITI
jgi:hypothetical protein